MCQGYTYIETSKRLNEKAKNKDIYRKLFKLRLEKLDFNIF